ncbi:hypothetical protein IT396_00730 [Candidatus Nomurabacteria bacterium]|nr:hypothetical protein [Candidatus Nomurabacteria bacterium]
MNSELNKLWQEHQTSTYPDEAHVSNLDFELADSIIAGCVSSFLESGTLENEKQEALNGSIEYISQHERELPNNAQPYFERLKTMGNLVLQFL